MPLGAVRVSSPIGTGSVRADGAVGAAMRVLGGVAGTTCDLSLYDTLQDALVSADTALRDKTKKG